MLKLNRLDAPKYNPDMIMDACVFIQQLIMSGGAKILKDPYTDAITILESTVDGDLTLYRGMALHKKGVDPSNISHLNNLKVCDPTPDYLMKKGNEYSSYTHRLSIAEGYAAGGEMFLIMKGMIPKSRILCDTRNLQDVLRNYDTPFDDKDFLYFQRTAEVIVREPVATSIFKISGNL